MIYDKPPKNIEDLAEKLISINNLTGISKDELSSILSNISYYRLKGYIHPYFETKDNQKVIKEGITWDTIWSDYNFDIELQALLYKEIGKIEIILRNRLIDIFSNEYGAFWYNESKLFHKYEHFIENRCELYKNWGRSRENFKDHFISNYESDPPAWMIFETTSFGNLSKIYQNIKSKYRVEIAKYFKFNKHSEDVLVSWFRHLVHIRNIIAHYGRLFSKKFTVVPKIPKNRNDMMHNNLYNNKIFMTILIIADLLFISNYNYDNFIREFKSLLLKYPEISKRAMGFPDNWQDVFRL